MSLFVKLLAVPFVAIAVILGYYLNMTMPPDIHQPMLYRTLMGTNAVMNDMSSLYAWYHDLDPFRTSMEMQIWFLEDVYPGIQEHKRVSMERIAGVPVRVWRPETVHDSPSKNLRAVFYIHGGGFVGGSIYGYDPLAEKISKETHSVVFLIDYQRAFDSPSPGPLNECFDVVTEIMEFAEKWNVNPDKVIAAGDSAGGNLAAALTLRMRDEEYSISIAGQILLYPILQGIDLNLPSYVQNRVYKNLVTPASISHTILGYLNQSLEYSDLVQRNIHVSKDIWDKYGDFVSHKYLPSEIIPKGYTALRPQGEIKSKSLEQALTDPYNFPLMEEDLSDLPKAFIVTKENDCLRDDGFIYAKRLTLAGSFVNHVHDKLGFHGDLCFLNDPFKVEAADIITNQVIAFINSV